jgi:RNA polymerase sigma factor (sigma-70 family)
VTAPDTHHAVDAVFRIEQAKLIAGLTRMVRDVGLAEELAQEALLAALTQWPVSGIPDKPGAWLMATAKHRAIDVFRRNKLLERKHEELGYELEVEQETAQPDLDAALDDEVGDDLLRLMFISCHPILSPEGRAALTLRLLGGLTTEEIARAFLVPEPTVQQRIVRAKRTLAEKRVPFEVPRGDELTARLSSVLSVIYLIFNEGYSATAGDDWMRPQLCEEALRLGRILAELAQEEPEVHGLVALMEIQASRFGARTGPSGEPVLLLDQKSWLFRRTVELNCRPPAQHSPREARHGTDHRLGAAVPDGFASSSILERLRARYALRGARGRVAQEAIFQGSCFQPLIDHPSDHTIRDPLVKKVSKVRVRYRIKIFFDVDIDHPTQSLAHKARTQIL